MMKIMIAGDIHGSFYYCEKLLAAYEKEGCEKLLLLGDYLYHGPRNALPEIYDPSRVITMLNAMKGEILAVRGNCDTEVDQMVLNFPIMAEYAILYLNRRMIFATHGHLYGEHTPPPSLKAGDILLTGHTHVPKMGDYGDYIYANPGSVSIPKEGSAHSYMIMSDEGMIWKSLEGEPFMTYEF